MRRRADSDGFTLIEVLLAFTIAAVLLLPLLHTFSTGLDSVSRTASVSGATLVAQSALERIGPDIDPSTTDGFTRQVGVYRVSTRIKPYHGDGVVDGPALPVVPYDVTVTVNWRDNARTRHVALHAVRLGPPQEEAAP